MDSIALIEFCERCLSDLGYISFDAPTWRDLSPDNITLVKSKYGRHAMMALPDHEVAFFTWLKENDYPVWKDLWDSAIAPYLVSLSWLDTFSGERAGSGAFVISDLQEIDNYYFSPHLLLDKEAADFTAAAKERMLDAKSLTLAQLLAVEVSMGALDIWHFAYRHKVTLAASQKAVQELVDDRILIHVKKAEDLATYFLED